MAKQKLRTKERTRIRLRKNDLVEVIAGRDQGKRGKIIAVMRAEGRVLVQGVNFIKRHTKPSQQSRQGGIVEKEGPIHVSNVMLYCPKCDGPARVRIQVADKKDARGKRRREVLRICKRCGEALGGSS